MDPQLRDPLPFSNWVWLAGAALLAFALIWVASWAYAYRKSRVEPKLQVSALSALAKARYHKQIDQVLQEWRSGTFDQRDAHFALAALIRAAATEKTGVNFESATPREASELFPAWSHLTTALLWCEDETFPVVGAGRRVDEGAALAREVVDS